MEWKSTVVVEDLCSNTPQFSHDTWTLDQADSTLIPGEEFPINCIYSVFECPTIHNSYQWNKIWAVRWRPNRRTDGFLREKLACGTLLSVVVKVFMEWCKLHKTKAKALNFHSYRVQVLMSGCCTILIFRFSKKSTV